MLFQSITNNPIERMNLQYIYCYFNNAFDDGELKKICDENSKAVEESRVCVDTENKEVIDNQIRRSKVNFFSRTQKDAWIFDRINGIMHNLNQHYFNFDLNGYDSLQYTEYHCEDKGFYDWHMDTSFGITTTFDDLYLNMRKLSFVILLNDVDEFDGGEFYINAGRENKAKKIEELKKGTLIAFPSFIIHKVAPVTKGIRKSLVGWIIGPKFR